MTLSQNIEQFGPLLRGLIAKKKKKKLLNDDLRTLRHKSLHLLEIWISWQQASPRAKHPKKAMWVGSWSFCWVLLINHLLFVRILFRHCPHYLMSPINFLRWCPSCFLRGYKLFSNASPPPSFLTHAPCIELQKHP